MLTYKIAYLVRGKHIPVSRILAVTFTNKAANEMKERLVKISKDITTEKTSKKSTASKPQTENSIEDFLQSIKENDEVLTPEHFHTAASLKRI